MYTGIILPQALIRYLDGQTPAWEVMADTTVTHTVGRNYYYTIDYHELKV